MTNAKNCREKQPLASITLKNCLRGFVLFARASRRIWQQITDIFAECSIDYDKDSQITHDFYAMVQNKFHYAITGQTAAEIIDANAIIQKKTWAWLHGRILRMAEY